MIKQSNTPPHLQHLILQWFASNKRYLPWRKSYEPYHIWISEVMLQQTQMERVVVYFNKWIKRFPDIKSVANAPEEEVLKLWEGLGYYSRAKHLIKTAQILANEHRATIPADHSLLLTLPGIGKYTAGAIMSIAFNKDFPIVDANIERVFTRIFDIDTPVKGKEAQSFIWKKAIELLPTGKARNFNQALMELGALICLPTNPFCSTCPLGAFCLSRLHDTIELRPVSKRKKTTIHIEMTTGLLYYNDKIFIQKRPLNGVWANLWEFPGGRIERDETPKEALVREYREETEFSIIPIKKIKTVKHSYTRYQVTLHCYFCSLSSNRSKPKLHAAQSYRWVMPEKLSNYAFPAGHRKLIEFLESGDGIGSKIKTIYF